MKEKITKWFNQGLWTVDMCKNAVIKDIITPEDFNEITGELF